MSGIVDDDNYIFKKVLNVIDKTTGLGTVEYLYDDVKAGKEVKTKTPKAGALGGTPPPPEDLKGKGKTTLNTENLFGDEQPKESLYQDGRDSRSYAINKVVSGESGSKVEDKGDTINLGKAPRSLFNNWTLHRYSNRSGIANYSKDEFNGFNNLLLNFNKDFEFFGDIGHESNTRTLTLTKEHQKYIKTYTDRNIKTIVVLVSGRPLVVTDQIEKSDGFVAAWLPGSEGGNGISDVIFGDYDFTGKLSFA